jgi:hypothetical protein
LLPGEHPSRRPGLNDHHRDVVRDHIVQLTGDPPSLDHDRRLRLQLSLLVELAVREFQRLTGLLTDLGEDTEPENGSRGRCAS